MTPRSKGQTTMSQGYQVQTVCVCVCVHGVGMRDTTRGFLVVNCVSMFVSACVRTATCTLALSVCWCVNREIKLCTDRQTDRLIPRM